MFVSKTSNLWHNCYKFLLLQETPDDFDGYLFPLDPSQKQHFKTLKKLKNPSKIQKTELKFLKGLRWIKTISVKGREQHVKELEAVDVFTEGLMKIYRFDIPLRYKLPDGKFRNLLDYLTGVPKRHIESPFACVTSFTVNVTAFKKKYGISD